MTIPVSGQNPIDELWKGIQQSKSASSQEARDQSVSNLLDNFQTNVSRQTGPIPIDRWKVSSIIDELDALSVSKSKIKLFISSVLQLDTPGKMEEKTAPVILQFICDLDAPDHNGAMMDELINGIEHGHPIVTTQTLFRGTGIKEKFLSSTILINKMSNFNESYRCYTDGNFIVLIPNNLDPRRLDLVETLQLITTEELFKLTQAKPTIEQFCSLFESDPKNDKLIYIGGHGGVGRPAGLSTSHYSTFLDWADKQRCKGLLVTSCFSGGESNLLHIGKEESVEPARFEPRGSLGVSFPVFIRSVGDYPSLSGQEAEKDLTTLFNQLAKMIEAPGARTIPRVRQILQEVEKDKRPKEPVNLMQAYFPPSGDSPGGFRTIGEDGRSFSITYARYRQEQIKNKTIMVSKQPFVDLFPAVIEAPLEFKDSDPVLLSLIPGKATHVISDVTLATSQPINYLKQQVQFYKRAKLGVNKVLCFGSLHSKKEELTQVVVNVATGLCIYRKGNSFFHQELFGEKGAIEISPFQFYLISKEYTQEAAASESALR